MTAEIATLCSDCHRVTRAAVAKRLKLAIDLGPQRQRTLSDVEQARSAGCPICKWLVHDMRKLREFTDFDPVDPYVEVMSSCSETWRPYYKGLFILDYSIAIPRGDGNWQRAWFAKATVEYFDMDALAQGRSIAPPSSNSGDKATLDLARYWFAQCTMHHNSCKIQKSKGHPPHRLVYVQGEPDGSISARLQDTTTEAQDPFTYLALSHRWLQDDPVRLLSTTASSMYASIPVCALKQSIQDALAVTLGLGFSYLWVDSLCIIQDSAEDKAGEIARMHCIYSQAQCTIVADSSYSVEAGCFVERDADLLKSFVISIKLQTDVNVTYHIDRLGDSADNYELMRTATVARAWCFQERMLSPRLLRFCNHQVHWQCQELEASESEPYGKRNIEKTFLEMSPMKRLPSQSDMAESKQPHDLSFDFWRTIVRAYSHCKMTFDTDKLLALTAVESFYRTRFEHDRYLWGIWTSSMPYALLWRTGTSRDKQGRIMSPRRLASSIAPSWSWASIASDVYLGERSNIIAALVDNAQGESALNTHADAVLSLRTHFWTRTLYEVLSPGNSILGPRDAHYKDEDVRDSNGRPVMQRAQPGFAEISWNDPQPSESNQELGIDFDSEADFPLEVTYAPIQIQKRHRHPLTRFGTKRNCKICLLEQGLVLVKVPGSFPLTYKRIGIFTNAWHNTLQYSPRGDAQVIRIE